MSERFVDEIKSTERKLTIRNLFDKYCFLVELIVL